MGVDADRDDAKLLELAQIAAGGTLADLDLLTEVGRRGVAEMGSALARGQHGQHSVKRDSGGAVSLIEVLHDALDDARCLPTKHLGADVAHGETFAGRDM